MNHSDKSYIKDFFEMESAGGIVLMFATVLALLVANSPWSHIYNLFIDTPVEVRVGGLVIAKPLLLWINDGLMAVFFFLVGLELKRELVEGQLSDRRSILLPAAGALGGMLIPSLIYVAFNYTDPVAFGGWAIPAATDIAFALGILSLLGSRVPSSIKVFLTSVAIFDDLGAIVIIALFYTADLSLGMLLLSACGLPVLWWMNRRGVESRSLYMLVGLLMWVAMLKSGVHATLTGVIVAMFIPLRVQREGAPSPLRSLEHDLHSVVAFFVLPVFAFANAGISLLDMEAGQFFHPVTGGIAFGLFIGKQLGVFGLSWLVIRTGLSDLPEGMNLRSLYGTAALCGVGFTMSLFIGSLAFGKSGIPLLFDERVGIMLGSLVSGIAGYLVLRYSFRESPEIPRVEETGSVVEQ